MFQQRTPVLLSILIVFCLAASSPLAAEDACAGATPMAPGDSLRGYARSGETFLVRLEVPSPGILSLAAAVPGIVAAEPGLAFSQGCGPNPGLVPRVLERSVSHLVAMVESPGAYFFRLLSRDPRRPLADFKLISGFVPDTGGPPTKDGENEEVIEIDALIGRGAPPARDGENEEVIEIDALIGRGAPPAHDGENEEVIEIDASVFPPASAGGRSLHSQLDRLCRSGEVDDHGDTFPCATFLSPGQTLAGELSNGWGDDADLFHFVLGAGGSEPWTVEIATAGGVDTAGALYDRAGQRLDAADEDGEGDNFRIVRSLRPGAYFVRVEGRGGAEGLYALSVGASR